MRFLGFFLTTLLLAGSALAQSYSLQDVLQEVFVQRDGTVRVEDTRSLVLNGDFSDRVEQGNTYFINIEPGQGSSVTFESLEALDGGLPVQAQINGNEIAWKVRGANETRRFKFSYTLTNELQVATDVARFNRQVLEPSHAPVRGYTLVIHPPAPSPEQFKVFIFNGSGRIGTLDFAPDFSTATVGLEALSENEPLRSDVLLDAALFDFQTIDQPMEQQWLNELGEQTGDFRRESAQVLQGAGRGPPPAPPSPLWAGLVWAGVAAAGLWVFRSYRRYGREPEIPEVGPYYREPAEQVPPATVPFILSQSDPGLKAASPAIAATLLDFARRGYLTLESTTQSGFLGLGSSEKVRYHLAKRPENLTPFEADLWKAFEGAAGAQNVFDADDLKRYFEKRPSFGRNWVAKPRAWYESTHGSLLDSASNVAVFTVPPLCFMLAAGALFGAFSVSDSSGLLTVSLFAGAALLAVFGVLAAVSLRRWDADKLLNAKRWEAYRRFLSDFSLMRESPAEHYKLWDYHFVYATALGVSKQYLKNLQKLMSAEPDKFVTPVWLYGYGGPGMGRVPTPGDLETLSRSLNTLSQIETNLGNLNSALSPQTKTGGGFSGGGGGFGGGGFSGGGSSGGGGGSGMR